MGLERLQTEQYGQQDDDMRLKSLSMYTAFFLGTQPISHHDTDIALGSAKQPFHMKGFSLPFLACFF